MAIVDLPENWVEIEAVLLNQPGYCHRAPIRERQGWTIDYLGERTNQEKAQVDLGIEMPRALFIGVTRVRVTGDNGELEFRDSIRVLNPSGDRVIYLPEGTTAQRPSSPVRGMMRWNSQQS